MNLLGDVMFGLAIVLAAFLASIGLWSETSFPDSHPALASAALALAVLALKCGVVVLCGYLARIICRRSD